MNRTQDFKEDNNREAGRQGAYEGRTPPPTPYDARVCGQEAEQSSTLPVIISRLFSSRCEDTTSPIVTRETSAA